MFVDSVEGLRGAEGERQRLVADEAVDALGYFGLLGRGGLRRELREEGFELWHRGAGAELAGGAHEGAVQLGDHGLALQELLDL